jgi:peptidoglycan/LPS O-acetylase OafA/YrhL
MPEPLDRGHRYIRGLDGLRAVAVLAVLAFHLGLTWAPGGLLGVGIFFTLSGYLITDLLMGRWEHDGQFRLGQFWLGRARRLLPALLLLLAGVTIWVSLGHRSQLRGLWGNIGAAAGYFSNWWLIFHHVSYFARFGPPSPLGHLWSLAIEEQFYLVWPWLLFLGVRFVHSRRALAGIALVGAGLSALEMALLWHPGVDPTRVYDGTDTRAFALLIGAALAFVWPSRPRRDQLIRWNPRLLDGLGLAGLIAVAVMIGSVGEYSAFLYRGGLVLLSVATAAIVAAVVHPGGILGRVLGMRPLRWLGVRSYGIYLWHYPIIVLTTPTLARGVSVFRSSLQVAAALAVAGLSWRYVENPIRSGNWQHFKLPAWRPGRRQVTLSGVLTLSTGTLGVLALLTLAVMSPTDSEHGITRRTDATTISTGTTTTTTARATATARATMANRTRATHLAFPPTSADPAPATTTSCHAVVHIGDSTSESLVSADYLPDPSQRLDAQYRRVGVTTTDMQISGARSIVETYDGQPNGYEVAQQTVASGFHGCWVIALGTNDAANIAVGSNVGEDARIQRMMSVIGDQPVLWVNAVSLLGSGPYSATNMQHWDRTLVQDCGEYPNFRVYDWASAAQPSWFISDGIHYSSAGSAQRAALIADALAEAFPKSELPSGCVVR